MCRTSKWRQTDRATTITLICKKNNQNKPKSTGDEVKTTRVQPEDPCLAEDQRCLVEQEVAVQDRLLPSSLCRQRSWVGHFCGQFLLIVLMILEEEGRVRVTERRSG